ncbi:MAG: ABC transporter ATP-binding protein [Gaiellaceae bacterium]
MSALLEINDLKKHFPVGRGFLKPSAWVYAVDGVSFEIARGETLALVGESGCGKSTVGRAILKLFDVTDGQVVLDGQRIDDLSAGALWPMRRRMQVVFQDPFSSLNPRMRVKDIVAEPIRNFGLAKSAADLDARVAALLDRVRLPREAANRWPHEFSGGQRQRIGIARAIVLEPKLIVADEPVSALDVSIQAQVLNLLQELRDEMGLTLVFIAHDLSVVRHMCDRIAVMYLGKIVELASSDRLYDHPRHPYTGALLSAVPVAKASAGRGRRRVVLEGDVPSPVAPPPACRFHTRCWKAEQVCREVEPPLEPKGTHDVAACHFPLSEGEVDALTERAPE